MIGFYHHTVDMTSLSLLVSTAGLLFAVAGHPFAALFCLMASGICDMFDGKIARTRQGSTDEERRFGIQLDSLCDIVCFGVLPAVIGVTVVGSHSIARYLAWVVGAMLILGALIRLAYFNVTEETRQATEGGRRTHYTGLPVTSAAVIFPFAFGLSLLLPDAATPWIYSAFALATAICFVCPFRVRKPHGLGLVILGLLGLAEFGALLLIMNM